MIGNRPIADQGHGAEGVGRVPPLRAMRRSNGAASVRLGEVPPAGGEEAAGGAAEGDLQRRGTPASASGRRVDPVVFVEESERKEWVAQVEPGVLITFLSLPRGGNDLKQIKFRYPWVILRGVGGVLIGWGDLIIVFCMLFNE